MLQLKGQQSVKDQCRVEKEPRFNRLGKRLGEDEVQLPVSDSYYKRDSSGKIETDLQGYKKYNWSRTDELGFVSGQYESMYLKKGTTIIRYGNPAGRYAAPVGTLFTELALPYRLPTCEYNEYLVTDDDVVEVQIVVYEGKAAKQPAWSCEKGGGTQYYFPGKYVSDYINHGLDRIDLKNWSNLQDADKCHP